MSALLLLAQALYTDHGNPTAAEQRVLEIINRARANPDAEAARLNILVMGVPDAGEGMSPADAADVGPRPPLAMNGLLLGVARAHSLDMWTRAFFAHVNPSGQSPSDRMLAAGYNRIASGENIAAATSWTAEQLEDFLFIDDLIAGRGHRLNLLDVDPGSTTYFREIGVGYYAAPSTVEIPPGSGDDYGTFLTQNFGRTSTSPFLLGVVYIDANGNDFYDIGEGLGGVSVTPSSGAFRAVSASAGGYAFPTASAGGINVTFSSSSLAADVVVGVTLSAANQKLDLKIAPPADGDGDGLPNFWESDFEVTPGAGLAPGDDTDLDGHTNLLEFRGGSNPRDAGSTPASPAAPPPPSPGGGSSSGGGGGGCGLTGFEVLLLALLPRARRRV